MVPAFSWNSLIHQHSYEISCRKDFFIGCDKNPGSGGESDQGTDGWESKPPIFGLFFLSFSLWKADPEPPAPGKHQNVCFILINFSSGAIPSPLNLSFIILWDTSFLCFSIIFFCSFCFPRSGSTAASAPLGSRERTQIPFPAVPAVNIPLLGRIPCQANRMVLFFRNSVF